MFIIGPDLYGFERDLPLKSHTVIHTGIIISLIMVVWGRVITAQTSVVDTQQYYLSAWFSYGLITVNFCETVNVVVVYNLLSPSLIDFDAIKLVSHFRYPANHKQLNGQRSISHLLMN